MTATDAAAATDAATEPLLYRWTPDEFVRAWEAGAFDRRVELVEGEVWAVVIGPWHGKVTARVVRALPGDDVEVTMATLPAGDSLPDPDCWVLRAGASPAGTIGRRLASWRAEDVLLVVEVSDESVLQDLGVKARLYGRAGYAVYWVVTRDAIYEHTDPTSSGYRTRVTYTPGDRVPVGYAGIELEVAALLAAG
ncbi:MAG: Uma2 family endonuclease [Actinomycetota bacterium]|nr:Uma2 family endonuclease [Actinomycetota bacterium]